jgi:hypothetical protein
MNKEKYNQIIDEAYGKFITEATSIKEGYENGDLLGSQPHVDDMFSNPDELIILTKEEFAEKCKTDKEFSKRWELKIEERELYLVERIRIAKYENEEEIIKTRKENINQISERLLKDNIPTRAISLTYNNETIEVYE